MIGFSKVKRQWGYIWESHKSFSIEDWSYKSFKLRQIVIPDEIFKYEGDWGDRFANRPLRFRFITDEDAKIATIMFYDSCGWFDD